jgi:hypothetical protein
MTISTTSKLTSRNATTATASYDMVVKQSIPYMFRLVVLMVMVTVIVITNSHILLFGTNCWSDLNNNNINNNDRNMALDENWPTLMDSLQRQETTTTSPPILQQTLPPPATTTLPTTTTLPLSSSSSSSLSSNNSNNFTNPLQKSHYAYMFLVGGIKPEKPSYRGFVYNVMVSTYLLKKHGSKADVVFFVQMSLHTNATSLPEKEEDVLRQLGVQIRYMEKPQQYESFADINMEKFRILTLTEYRRVIFMDADVVPAINMDYLMELSDGEHPLLQPNFVVAAGAEPSNGGLFMMTPRPGDYQALLKVIDDQRESAKHLKFPFFDRDVGWGHSFSEHGDQWDGLSVSKKNWEFFGAHVDQGLLYYWTKYHQQAVTIFKGNIVENWVAGGEQFKNKPFLQSSFHPSLVRQYSPKHHFADLYRCSWLNTWDKYLCKPPYNDYAHFIGNGKPWQRGWDAAKMNDTSCVQLLDAERLWFRTIFELSDKFGFNITESNVNELFQWTNPLGTRPELADMARRQQNWTITTTTTSSSKETNNNKAEYTETTANITKY